MTTVRRVSTVTQQGTTRTFTATVTVPCPVITVEQTTTVGVTKNIQNTVTGSGGPPITVICRNGQCTTMQPGQEIPSEAAPAGGAPAASSGASGAETIIESHGVECEHETCTPTVRTVRVTPTHSNAVGNTGSPKRITVVCHKGECTTRQPGEAQTAAPPATNAPVPTSRGKITVICKGGQCSSKMPPSPETTVNMGASPAMAETLPSNPPMVSSVTSVVQPPSNCTEEECTPYTTVMAQTAPGECQGEDCTPVQVAPPATASYPVVQGAASRPRVPFSGKMLAGVLAAAMLV